MSDEPEVLQSDAEEVEIVETVAPAPVDEAEVQPSLGDDIQTTELPEEAPPAEGERSDDEPAAEEDEAQSAQTQDEETPAADEERPDDQPAAEEAVADAEAEPEEEPEREEGRHWYVVHSYSGYENKVKKNLESRIESMGMHDFIFEVVVPTEEVVELRDGRRRTVEQRIFPGYILVDMILNDDSWFVVRNTPGVTGFVGSGNQPTPLRQEEADTILQRMEEEAPKVKVSFRIGDSVRIVDGPFTDFMGTVDDLNLEKGKVRLLVSFFGRETPVELDFLQVEMV
jgi:transcriptional antiterminator NusG